MTRTEGKLGKVHLPFNRYQSGHIICVGISGNVVNQGGWWNIIVFHSRREAVINDISKALFAQLDKWHDNISKKYFSGYWSANLPVLLLLCHSSNK